MNKVILSIVGLLVLWRVSAFAEVHLNGLFTDNMVLQRDAVVPVWGTADPGEKITVEVAPSTGSGQAGQKKSVVTDSSNHWNILLDPMTVSSKPWKMTVRSSIGDQTLVIENILVGDVWVCGGQSNMDFPMQSFLRSGKHPIPDEVISQNTDLVNGTHENIRVILLDKQYRAEEQSDIVVSKAFNDSWQGCTDPKITGAASAVGFFFGRALNRDLQVPVGLIDANKGGTRVELWTPARTLGLTKKPVETDGVAKGNSVLYNGMIAPLMPFAIKGVIWYQGEANAHSVDEAAAYEKSFAAMISAWRENWGQGDFPFLFVQLAAFRSKSDMPSDENWPVLRDSQTAALKLPNIGMASAIDLGQEKNIHPFRKEDVGERLALAAKKVAYGMNGTSPGPVFQSLEIQGNQAVVTFKNTGGGLVAKEVTLDTHHLAADRLQGFAICGADQKFVWADAVIDGDTVVVSSPDVPEPVAVRYAWQNFPLCNLYNTDDLPAVPFRTDTFDVNANPTRSAGRKSKKS